MTSPRVDRTSGTVPAPPETVWRAWAEPELLARWLPPEGATAEIAEHDLRPGGALRMVLTFADAPGKTTSDTDALTGRFAEVDAPRSLRLDVDFDAADPRFAGTMRMDWSFTPDAGGTRVDVACRDVPDGIDAADHAAGLASSLGNLDRLCAELMRTR